MENGETGGGVDSCHKMVANEPTISKIAEERHLALIIYHIHICINSPAAPHSTQPSCYVVVSFPPKNHS